MKNIKYRINYELKRDIAFDISVILLIVLIPIIPWLEKNEMYNWEQLSFAVFVGSIFYIVQVYIPKRRRVKSANEILRVRTIEIIKNYKTINFIIEQCFPHVDDDSYKKDKYRDNIYIKKIRSEFPNKTCCDKIQINENICICMEKNIADIDLIKCNIAYSDTDIYFIKAIESLQEAVRKYKLTVRALIDMESDILIAPVISIYKEKANRAIEELLFILKIEMNKEGEYTLMNEDEIGRFELFISRSSHDFKKEQRESFSISVVLDDNGNPYPWI
ncbi:MAG: hypothetical protein JJE03_03005 [Peptostreptococcaceae bacterium]|nr:hypothetical protein [Peptostreptococcaceae bacterium]